MSFWSSISGLQNDINASIGDIEQKIERLKRAKQRIQTEQESVLQEIKHLKRPDLNHNWVGERATHFDEKREDIYEIMEQTATDSYDLYQFSIQIKITSLELQRSGLSGLNSIANEASQLLSVGEEAYDEVSSKISQIRRELFS